MTKKDDIRRLADAAERIAISLEKIAGVSDHQVAATAGVPDRPLSQLAAPIFGDGDHFHAVSKHYANGARCRVSRGLVEAKLDFNRAVLATTVPTEQRCTHSGCVRGYREAEATTI